MSIKSDGLRRSASINWPIAWENCGRRRIYFYNNLSGAVNTNAGLGRTSEFAAITFQRVCHNYTHCDIVLHDIFLPTSWSKIAACLLALSNFAVSYFLFICVNPHTRPARATPIAPFQCTFYMASLLTTCWMIRASKNRAQLNCCGQFFPLLRYSTLVLLIPAIFTVILLF
jgi:hypothetical protein